MAELGQNQEVLGLELIVGAVILLLKCDTIRDLPCWSENSFAFRSGIRFCIWKLKYLNPDIVTPGPQGEKSEQTQALD